MNCHVSARAVRRLAAVALALAALTPCAQAYRPFDGTDAAVAETGVFELNYGLAHDTEIVLEGQYHREFGGTVDGSRNSLDDTQFSVKHVWVKGSLQDGAGPSVASECAVLLPEINGSSGTGGECAAIVSNKWEEGALHLNAGIGRTREHDWARTASLIAEGPESWKVRPVAEVLVERDNGGGRLHSALVGAIYQQSENLAFDLAFRRAGTNDGRFSEVRVGLTWSIPTSK